MFQNKRPLNFNEFSSVETKRLRRIVKNEKVSITFIENLSNELFYEIFEYLDHNDIHKTFYKLNSRFQNLVTHSSLPLKIKLNYPKTNLELKDYCENVLIPNKHRILSLDIQNQSLINNFLTHCIIDSSFHRLESIVLNDISIDKTMVLLFYLKSLPHLFSLSIYITFEGNDDLSDIYRMIFSLSSLKYNKLSLWTDYGEDIESAFVPLAINEQFSTIEYLVIDHDCSFNMLLSMLHHTPRLRSLKCAHLKESDINTKQPVMLSNLIYICITYPPSRLKDFEIFMMKLSAQIQVLIIKYFFDESYLDGDRWKRIILKYTPHLRSFHLSCDPYVELDLENSPLTEFIGRFTSSFWIERQWFPEFVIENIYKSCCIYRYRKIWMDIYKHVEIAKYFNQKGIENFAIQSLPVIQLTINRIPLDEAYQTFIDEFKSSFVPVQFTRLNINCKNISIRILATIIDLLPNLDSLNVSFLPFVQPRWLFDDDGDIRFLTSIKNKITKINLENIINIEQIHLILYICLSIQYLQIDMPEDMDLEILVRCILIKSTTYIPHLCSLCLSNISTNEDMVDQLEKMIKSEKLLTNYMLKRISDHILIKWD